MVVGNLNVQGDLLGIWKSAKSSCRIFNSPFRWTIVCRLSVDLGFPLPTMTFPNNRILISISSPATVPNQIASFALDFTTVGLLYQVAKKTHVDWQLPDAQDVFWEQKRLQFPF